MYIIVYPDLRITHLIELLTARRPAVDKFDPH